ncbi:hypothetical protein H8E88_01970 [candidate division KSB1 bacterium]|nr:hypothetical protein [candidate division KSB1 bacterium]
MKLNRSSQSIKTKLNRPEKGGLSRFQRGSFRREGKKEGVWGRNFCLPVSFPFGFAQGSFTRRPRGGGRRGRELPRKLYHLFIFFFKISPNFGIEGQPTRILRFFRGFLVWNFQAASHFLPPELKVRLRKAQSSAPMVKVSYHWAEQPIFCISPKAKLPNFRKESDNFSVRSTVCPKAITI